MKTDSHAQQILPMDSAELQQGDELTFVELEMVGGGAVMTNDD